MIMRRSGGGLFRTVLAGGFLVVIVYIVATVIGWDLLPFQTSEKDHSPPPILTEIRELSDFHAAQAQFEVVVDEEKDVRFLPQAIAGERVQFVAVGTVDAMIDFSSLSTNAVRFDAETGHAVVYLPRPVIGRPVIDHDQSHVMNRDRGLFNRLGGVFNDNPTAEGDLYDAAEQKMAVAASQTGLVAMAEQSAQELLEPMITNLGVTSVDVRFYDGEQPPKCSKKGCS
jgi:hypothetical protein